MIHRAFARQPFDLHLLFGERGRRNLVAIFSISIGKPENAPDNEQNNDETADSRQLRRGEAEIFGKVEIFSSSPLLRVSASPILSFFFLLDDGARKAAAFDDDFFNVILGSGSIKRENQFIVITMQK